MPKGSDKRTKADATCDKIEDFFAMPDKIHTWNEWMRLLVEDLLVIDAATIYPRMNKGGGLYALEPMDGAMVKVLIDQTGRSPLPPLPAYQQILKGLPVIDYTTEELIYRPRNIRTNRMYGYSPVEQILVTVNIAMRRQMSQLEYYTEGSVPTMMFGTPTDWGADQIREFQDWFNSMLAGNTAQRAKARFIPGGKTKSLKTITTSGWRE